MALVTGATVAGTSCVVVRAQVAPPQAAPAAGAVTLTQQQRSDAAMAEAKVKLPLSGWMITSAPSERLVTTTGDSLYYSYVYGLFQAGGSGTLTYNLAVVFPWPKVADNAAAAAEMTRFFGASPTTAVTVATAAVESIAAAGRTGFVAYLPDSNGRQCAHVFAQLTEFDNVYSRLCASSVQNEPRVRAAVTALVTGLLTAPPATGLADAEARQQSDAYMAAARFKFPLSGWLLRAAPTKTPFTTTAGSLFDMYTYVLTDPARNLATVQYQLATGFQWGPIGNTAAAAAELERFFKLPNPISPRDVLTVTTPLRRGYAAFVRRTAADPMCGYFLVQPTDTENVHIRLCAAATSSDADFRAAAMQLLEGLRRA